MSVLEYLPFSTQFIVGTGLLVSSSRLRKFISIIILLPATLLLNFLIIFNFAHAKGNILLIAEAFESLSTFGQLTVRKFILLKHGQLIEEIVDDCKHQWKYDLFGPEIEAELRKKMDFCVNLAKALAFCSTSTITLMCATALLDDAKPVPLVCWIPDLEWATEIIFISEMIILFETLYYVVATDSFYLLIGMDIQIQFRLMSEIIKSIQFGVDDDEECLAKLIKCVRHHRWLLRLHQKVNKVFSEYFIMQYTITVTAVAIQVYLLLYRSPSFDAILKSVVYFFTVMFQVALYFIPASNIEIEAENFSSELYFSNWESNKNFKTSKHLLFMLLKSQQSLNMMGAGMLHVNRPEYLIIVRVGFTIATILGGLK